MHSRRLKQRAPAMAAFFWAAPRTRLMTSRRAAARRRRHPAAAAHTARHTRRTDRAQTAERLQTSDVRCIIGELHDDNTRVANLHANHTSCITRANHAGTWHSPQHRGRLAAAASPSPPDPHARPAGKSHVTDQCRDSCSSGGLTCMNAATEGDALTPCARQRTPAAHITQGISTMDKNTAL